MVVSLKEERTGAALWERAGRSTSAGHDVFRSSCCRCTSGLATRYAVNRRTGTGHTGTDRDTVYTGHTGIRARIIHAQVHMGIKAQITQAEGQRLYRCSGTGHIWLQAQMGIGAQVTQAEGHILRRCRGTGHMAAVSNGHRGTGHTGAETQVIEA